MLLADVASLKGFNAVELLQQASNTSVLRSTQIIAEGCELYDFGVLPLDLLKEGTPQLWAIGFSRAQGCGIQLNGTVRMVTFTDIGGDGHYTKCT